jgi:predicted pyridoxine 5'-phosphate oxidase superfamily flavin-nucleotide-binding protein
VWRDFKGHREFNAFGENEQAFIADRDSFYMATVSETGWPYVQHRGGPRGFLKVLDEHSLAFADYRGNKQYISTGNVAANDRVCLFLMDYPRKARLKIYAHVETLDLEEAFDWNCAQHITPRFAEREIMAVVGPLQDRLDQLEAENADLRARLASSGAP